MRIERQSAAYFGEGIVIETDAEADFGEFGIVVALERVEVVGAAFCGAVSPPELVFEENCHLAHCRHPAHVLVSRYLKCRNQILLTVSAHLSDREL